MKTALLLAAAMSTFGASALAQGILNLNPVPVTNSLTGLRADSSIVAGLFGGPVGAPESELTLLAVPSPLVNGFAVFGSPTPIPGFAPGISITIGVRAWSAGYATYDDAVASGLGSVLAGRSTLANVTIGGTPTPQPVPGQVTIPGFTVYPVPESSTSTLLLTGAATLLGLRTRRWRHRALNGERGAGSRERGAGG